MWNVERATIQPIPESERHGSIRDLFTLWFSANMQITTIATGAILGFLGLSIPWIIVAIVLGNIIGAAIMSLHSTQGPAIGVPQMIQTRAQFGFTAAILPILVVLLSYVGFWASSAVLGGSAIARLTHSSTTLGIGIVFVLTSILTIFGYDLIHRYQRYMSWLFGAAFLVWTVAFLTGGHLAHVPVVRGVHWGVFFLGISIALSWQITYSVAVSDYSRYLPKALRARSTFINTFLGTTIASVWMMVIGALLSLAAPRLGDVSAVGRYAGSLAWAMMIVMLLGVVSANVINSYGGMLCVETIIGTFIKLKASQNRRASLILAVGVAGGVLAILGQGNFLNNLTNFILFLLYLAIPWSAINLVDFYFVRHGQYDPRSFSEPGSYGQINGMAITAYLLGFLIELPFMNSTIFEGPIAKSLNGADISWVPGIIVSAGLYYMVMRGRVQKSNQRDSIA